MSKRKPSPRRKSQLSRLRADLKRAEEELEKRRTEERERNRKALDFTYNLSRARESADQLSLDLNRIAQERCDAIMKSCGIAVRARVTLTVGA